MLSDSGNRHAGRVDVTADRLLSPTKEVRWPLSSINSAKRGGGEKEAELLKEFCSKSC
jgi:hypothetical protein